jgi:ribosomal protein S18 acetylase RimI-like enzyme
MTFPAPILRFAAYFKRHGLWATAQRAGLAVRRSLFSSRHVLFYCDLHQQLDTLLIFEPLKVERKRSLAELEPVVLEKMMDVWNPVVAGRNLKERFKDGASLWLIKYGDRLAGYGWTLQGRTVEPHYLPLSDRDVHLFDFHVFPEYRGRGYNPLLVSRILNSVATDGGERAFIEAAEWNQSQLSSLNRTPFRRLGMARKVTIFGRPVVWWAEDEGRASSEKHQARSVVATRNNTYDSLQ